MTSTYHDEEAKELLHPLVVRARQRVGQVLRQRWHLDELPGVGGMEAVYAEVNEDSVAVVRSVAAVKGAM